MLHALDAVRRGARVVAERPANASSNDLVLGVFL